MTTSAMNPLRQSIDTILVIYSDQSDAVARAVIDHARRFECDVVALSLRQFLDEVRAGTQWTWAGRSIDPARTAVVNRVISMDTDGVDRGGSGVLDTASRRNEAWTFLHGELRRFAYVSSMPSAVSPVGSLGSLLDQWSDLPEMVGSLRVPEHSTPWSPRPLTGDVYAVNPWNLYSLGKRVSQGAHASAAIGPTGELTYVRPAGMLFHIAQVGAMFLVANAPPGVTGAQKEYVMSFVRTMAERSDNRILEHAFFVGNDLPVFYSTCPVPVVVGALPAYSSLVVEGLQDDIKNRSRRAAP